MSKKKDEMLERWEVDVRLKAIVIGQPVKSPPKQKEKKKNE
jgi:hypothetical protein